MFSSQEVFDKLIKMLINRIKEDKWQIKSVIANSMVNIFEVCKNQGHIHTLDNYWQEIMEAMFSV